MSLRVILPSRRSGPWWPAEVRTSPSSRADLDVAGFRSRHVPFDLSLQALGHLSAMRSFVNGHGAAGNSIASVDLDQLLTRAQWSQTARTIDLRDSDD